MFEVTSLGSGSSGNALLIRTPTATLLVDCGVTIRRLTAGLASRGLTLADVDVVLVSHEHVDHTRELSRLMSLGATAICTRGTAIASQTPRTRCQEVAPRRPVRFAGIEIRAIPVSHDAAEPCGFFVQASAGSLVVATDLGQPGPELIEAVAAADLVVLEANHDERLLRRGPYPAYLQRRILSDAGHLSNDACAGALQTALGPSRRLPTVWLAHLSQTNNRPSLATQTVERRLVQVGIRLDLHALPRREVGPTWNSETRRVGVAQLPLELA
jgi:phosphoribosyl 1,2-cyclic phosphodiesterase